MTIQANDQKIRQEIVSQLDFEPSISSRDIGVTVEDGVVTLHGHVPNYVQKMKAEKVAWRVKGVRALAQEIEVRLPGGQPVHDDEIARRAVNMLEWNAVIPKSQIHIKVQNGWVTMSGEVDWNYQRIAAEKSVRGITGVLGINNEVTIKQVATATPDKIRKEIVEALKRQAEHEANKIAVNVRPGGEVELEGNVPTWSARETIESAAWAVPGVTRVKDKLMLSAYE